MFCDKCGNKLDETDVFCGNCGASVIRNDYNTTGPILNNYSDNNQQKKNTNYVAIAVAIIVPVIIIIGVICFFVAVFLFVGNSFTKIENGTYIDINNYQVRSYFSLEDGKLCNYKSETGVDNETITLGICKTNNFKANVDNYFDYMIEKEGFEEISGDAYRTIGMKSGSGYSVVIIASLSDESITYKSNGK